MQTSLPGREQERARWSRLAAGCAAGGRWICAEPPHLPRGHRPASRPHTMSARAASSATEARMRLNCILPAGKPEGCPAETLTGAEQLPSFCAHSRRAGKPRDVSGRPGSSRQLTGQSLHSSGPTTRPYLHEALCLASSSPAWPVLRIELCMHALSHGSIPVHPRLQTATIRCMAVQISKLLLMLRHEWGRTALKIPALSQHQHWPMPRF